MAKQDTTRGKVMPHYMYVIIMMCCKGNSGDKLAYFFVYLPIALLLFFCDVKKNIPSCFFYDIFEIS